VAFAGVWLILSPGDMKPGLANLWGLGSGITAAAAIIFPVALTLAYDLQVDPMPFILVVAFASAANFMTPIGYQTNLMIYGPGSYKFKDFFKIGFPLTLIYMIVSILILNFIYF
jgi:di/tricarboxylate transporter